MSALARGLRRLVRFALPQGLATLCGAILGFVLMLPDAQLRLGGLQASGLPVLCRAVDPITALVCGFPALVFLVLWLLRALGPTALVTLAGAGHAFVLSLAFDALRARRRPPRPEDPIKRYATLGLPITLLALALPGADNARRALLLVLSLPLAVPLSLLGALLGGFVALARWARSEAGARFLGEPGASPPPESTSLGGEG